MVNRKSLKFVKAQCVLMLQLQFQYQMECEALFIQARSPRRFAHSHWPLLFVQFHHQLVHTAPAAVSNEM